MVAAMTLKTCNQCAVIATQQKDIKKLRWMNWLCKWSIFMNVKPLKDKKTVTVEIPKLFPENEKNVELNEKLQLLKCS